MQQINLYIEDLKPKIDLLGAEISAAVVVLTVVTLIGLTFFEKNKFSQQELAVIALEDESKVLQDKVSSQKSKPVVNRQTELASEIERVRASVKNRQQIEALFTGEDMGNKRGFSSFFFDMGNAIPVGVSVSKFSFSSAGYVASIDGFGKEAKTIAEFINNLQQKKSYKDTQFGSLVIEKRSGVNQFHIGPNDAPDMDMVLR